MGVIQYGEATVETVGNIGTASNEAEETVASSLFCVRTCARIADVLSIIVHAQSKLHHYDRT